MKSALVAYAKGTGGNPKNQHYHIKACWTTNVQSRPLTVGPQRFHSFTFPLLCIKKHPPKQIWPCCSRRSQTTDVSHGQQGTAAFSSLKAQQEPFHTGSPFSHSLLISPAPSRVPFWSRFDSPQFVHLSFLTGLSKIALILFTWEKRRPAHTASPKRGKWFCSTASSRSPLGWHGNAVSHLHRTARMFFPT